MGAGSSVRVGPWTWSKEQEPTQTLVLSVTPNQNGGAGIPQVTKQVGNNVINVKEKQAILPGTPQTAADTPAASGSQVTFVERVASEQKTPVSPRVASSKDTRNFLEVGFKKNRLKDLVKEKVVTTNDAQVLILYTGGTIGMEKTVRGYAPSPGYLPKVMEKMHVFQDPEAGPCTTPESQDGRRTQYKFIEYNPLLDSSCMVPKNWAHIAQDIYEHYDKYDGFVILHGTDTMAYTASALSFMLDGLSKPVILTGSQIPISELRNDAVENLLGAMLIAGHCKIPEVCLFFRSKLMRGNRTYKAASETFDAFDSPNLRPLANVGLEVDVNWQRVRKKPEQDVPLSLHLNVCSEVTVVYLFPGITKQRIASALAAPTRGAVLLTFGAGNAPDSKEFLDVLEEASGNGVILVNVTQCTQGGVNMASYAAGSGLSRAGVLSGHDMTLEASLCKLMCILGQVDNPVLAHDLMMADLRGELTLDKEEMQKQIGRSSVFDG